MIIRTEEELKALPPGTLIESHGTAWQRTDDPNDDWWRSTGGSGTTAAGVIFYGPVTVLRIPGRTIRRDVNNAVGAVVSNVSNFPRSVQARLLGQDMAPLREKITDAVMEAL